MTIPHHFTQRAVQCGQTPKSPLIDRVPVMAFNFSAAGRPTAQRTIAAQPALVTPTSFAPRPLPELLRSFLKAS